MATIVGASFDLSNTTDLTAIYGGAVTSLTGNNVNRDTVVGDGDASVYLTDADNNYIDLTGSDSSNVFIQGGDNTVQGSAGDDDIILVGNDNIVTTGNGSDTITVDGNNNFIGASGTGDKIIELTGIGNVAGGGAGADTVTSHGHNAANGGSGNDFLVAGGHDVLTGGSGNDVLHGEDGGFNLLVGGSGNDSLYGGNQDTLFGGSGNDSFYFGPNSGMNSIKDFTPGQDTLHFSAGTYGATLVSAAADVAFAAVAGATAQGVASVIITLGTDIITVKGISLTDLQGNPDNYIIVS